ncbi:hypothetical protein B0H63DRAFT_456923 [Podospora didyma]|uniref:Methyltransferase n=1 Tax=Podospora didyma TaxID=330526 RepID=A0AAE0P425_9PEZI|nr:hypothetical protein B0H63DRAFT_456923 [Podospora didyma]
MKKPTATKKKALPAVVYCVGSPNFDPKAAIEDTGAHEAALQALQTDNDLETAIRTWFGFLPGEEDKYVYHAIASVKLAQVQHAVRLGAANGLHAWYFDADGGQLPSPSQADIDAYISIFLPSTLTASALKTFSSNAKKGSVRALVARDLAAKRFIHPGHSLASQLISIPRAKKSSAMPRNPYFDFWAWSCRILEWCGPYTPPPPPSTSGTKQTPPQVPVRSHHILPIFMHHFGCAVPSHEALTLLKLIAAGRPIADIGSGNGYWAFMLRAYGVTAVYAVDNAQSAWRVTWIPDTIISDGAKWLSSTSSSSPSSPNQKDMVLLLVYPIVSNNFTRSVVAAYKGDTVAVVGTQNRNGYTAFADMTVDEFMVTASATADGQGQGQGQGHGQGGGWTKIIQIPLPSFAGKDEALFIFQRGSRAPAPAPLMSAPSLPPSAPPKARIDGDGTKLGE